MKNELCSLHSQGLRMHENFGYRKKGVLSQVAFLLGYSTHKSQHIPLSGSLFTLGF
jgi:hypothetical protein